MDMVSANRLSQVSRYGDGERATQFPGAMAIAAARSPSLVFDVAKATAEEMRAVGFNWNLAPVLDVNSDPRNPVIGVRSFGDDPRDVGRFGVTTAEGLNAGGVAGTSIAFYRRTNRFSGM